MFDLIASCCETRTLRTRLKIGISQNCIEGGHLVGMFNLIKCQIVIPIYFLSEDRGLTLRPQYSVLIRAEKFTTPWLVRSGMINNSETEISLITQTGLVRALLSDQHDTLATDREQHWLPVPRLEERPAADLPHMAPQQGGGWRARDGPLQLGQPGDGLPGDLTVAVGVLDRLSFQQGWSRNTDVNELHSVLILE